MLLVYGFLTQDFIPHEKPWTRIAKSWFCHFFVALACVSRHPPRLWSVLNELLVYGFLTRSAHVCYRTNEITMFFFKQHLLDESDTAKSEGKLQWFQLYEFHVTTP